MIFPLVFSIDFRYFPIDFFGNFFHCFFHCFSSLIFPIDFHWEKSMRIRKAQRCGIIRGGGIVRRGGNRIHLVLNDVNEQLEFSTREAAGSEATRVCPHARSPLALNSLSKLSAMKTQGLEPNKEYSQSAGRVNIGLRPYAKYCRTMSNR